MQAPVSYSQRPIQDNTQGNKDGMDTYQGVIKVHLKGKTFNIEYIDSDIAGSLYSRYLQKH